MARFPWGQSAVLFSLLSIIAWIADGVWGLGWPVSPGARLMAGEESAQIELALDRLEQTRTGKTLIEALQKRWTLVDRAAVLRLFRSGEQSRTDTTLTRHFDARTGHERLQREVQIELRRDQSLVDLTLDLAHEANHAANKPDWDPYDLELTPVNYVRQAIEGQGGEVSSLARECETFAELVADDPSLQREFNDRCGKYMRQASGASLPEPADIAAIRRDFYRVGAFLPKLREELGAAAEHLPELRAEPPRLLSSTGQAPYPVALVREFRQINAIACRNTRKRVESMAKIAASTPAERAPAAEATGTKSRDAGERARALRFLNLRCQDSEGISVATSEQE